MDSLIIPVYRNAETIGPLISALEQLARDWPRRLEVVFVVDGSPDESYALLKAALPRTSLTAELVSLSRNFGSFAAIKEGLRIARGECCAVMAADLQEPPELIRQFFQILREQPVDIVMGQRTARHDPPLSRFSSEAFWWIYRRMVQREMPPGGIDVFACTAQIRDVLVVLDEANSSLVGQLIWLGFRRALVPYVRQPRVAGRSAWTLSKKLQYLENSIFAFSALPITALTFIGGVGVVTSLVVSVVIYTSWWMGWIQVQGYTPLMLAMSLSTSSILLGLGIIGNYVWRTFTNSQGRPAAILLMRESFVSARDGNPQEPRS